MMRHVGAVIDVLFQRAASSRGPAAIADQPHRVDIQEQGSRTALSTRFRIEDVRLSKGESEGLHASRILMKQVPQVCCRPVSIRDCEKHPTPCYLMSRI